MEFITEFIRTDIFFISVAVLVLILLIAYIINLVKYSKLNKRYTNFMKKLGKRR